VLKTRLTIAKLIWASTTPVTVMGRPADLDPEINPIMIRHNCMAAQGMGKANMPVNDFSALLVNERDLVHGDRFHWTALAHKLVASRAAGSIPRSLPREPE
jgi:hypothetical protein